MGGICYEKKQRGINTHPQGYESYTGRENEQVISNLQMVRERIPQENYVVKVPLLPGYSEEKAVEESTRLLQELGIPEENILTFTYLV